MDKYDILFDLLEHPENYTSEQIENIMRDTETNELYHLVNKTQSAIHSKKALESVNVDSEWEKFESDNLKPRKKSHWRVNRAASIGIIAMSSLAAVAACITIAVTVSNNKPSHTAMDTVTVKATQIIRSDINNAESIDSMAKFDAPIMFEDDRLDDILTAVASHYNVNIVFKNHDTSALHLYYRFDPSLSLNEVIDQLNTFEQINITTEGKNIIVD